MENEKREVIGCFGIREMSYHSLEIVKVFVLEECRRMGIGKEIIEFVLEYAKRKGREGFLFATINKKNDLGLSFFLKCGFTIDDQFKRGENEIYFVKKRIF